MKILHVIISKGFAGSELYAINLLNYQSKFHNTFLIKINETNNVKYKKFLNSKTKVFNFNSFLKKFKINNKIDEINPDVVHTHLGNASKIVIKKNFKLVATLHMNYQKGHYSKHDGLIVSNDVQKEKASQSFKGIIKKSYLWPCSQNFHEANNIDIRKNLNIPKNSFIFGSIGRFISQKGFDIIVESFKSLNLDNCFLILIGNGHNEYPSYESKNIILLDHQDNVSSYLKSFDCYISASRWETFGIALIEAMSNNLPVITSIHEGNKEWINDFDVSIFTDAKDLRLKITEAFLKKPPKKKYDLDRFNYDEICKKITEFYMQL